MLATAVNNITTTMPAETTRTAVSDAPVPLAPPRWDWSSVRRILVVRLRSIGDTVLATSALHALKRFVPEARIDVLLEDWVAPILDGSTDVDRVITVKRNSHLSRLRIVPQLRAARYDVAFNLHGGSTATLLTFASGARHRVGYRTYRYRSLHNHLAPSSAELWKRKQTHSVEQQLALLGWTGIPVSDLPPTKLAVTRYAKQSITTKLQRHEQTANFEVSNPFALLHPAAAFATKQWAPENFARVAEHLVERGLQIIVIATQKEAEVARSLSRSARIPVLIFTDLSLPEVTALTAQARLFVGNDSGIAHIASALGVPSVVIFGSSNVWHWRPWTRAANEVVREEMPCAPCPGYTCREFAEPQCIKRVSVERVQAAVERVLMLSATAVDVDARFSPLIEIQSQR